MDKEHARALCQDYLDANEPEPSGILDIAAYDTKLFWYFRWNSREAVETRGARGYRKTPWIAVEKSTGTVHMLADGGPPPVTRPDWVSPATLEGARWIAQARLDARYVNIVLTDEFVERPRGWVFSYHRIDGETFVGAGPLFVDRRTGEIRELPGFLGVEEQLARWNL
jgi:hypothetical protein